MTTSNSPNNQPDNPIEKTAKMVKAIHWYTGADIKGSTHCTQKILEWVGQTPLDDSPENLESRLMLAWWVQEVAIKVTKPPFNDPISAERLIKCCLNIPTNGEIQAYLKKILTYIESGEALPTEISEHSAPSAPLSFGDEIQKAYEADAKLSSSDVSDESIGENNAYRWYILAGIGDNSIVHPISH